MGKKRTQCEDSYMIFLVNCISSLLKTTQSQQLVLKPQVITLTLNGNCTNILKNINEEINNIL
jgi:hypothetical protein